MCLCVLYGVQLARPVCMVPNIPGIPGPPLGGSSSGSNSPSGYSIHSEAKMVCTRLTVYFYLLIFLICFDFDPAVLYNCGLVVHHLTFYRSYFLFNPSTLLNLCLMKIRFLLRETNDASTACLQDKLTGQIFVITNPSFIRKCIGCISGIKLTSLN